MLNTSIRFGKQQSLAASNNMVTLISEGYPDNVNEFPGPLASVLKERYQVEDLASFLSLSRSESDAFFIQTGSGPRLIAASDTTALSKQPVIFPEHYNRNDVREVRKTYSVCLEPGSKAVPVSPVAVENPFAAFQLDTKQEKAPQGIPLASDLPNSETPVIRMTRQNGPVEGTLQLKGDGFVIKEQETVPAHLHKPFQPVLDQTGHLVGIVTQYQDGEPTGISVKTLKQFLNKNIEIR